MQHVRKNGKITNVQLVLLLPTGRRSPHSFSQHLRCKMRSLIAFQGLFGYEVFGSIIVPPYASESSRAVDLMSISNLGEPEATNKILGNGDRIKRDNKYHVKCKQSGTG